MKLWIAICTAALIAAIVGSAAWVNWHIDRSTPNYEWELNRLQKALDSAATDICEIKRNTESLDDRLRERGQC